MAADGLAHFHAVAVRQHQVQQDGLEAFLFCQCYGGPGTVGLFGVEVGMLEIVCHQL